MNPDPRPDFVIIGAMKCATSTLHVQLAAQPGFFMTHPKEPNYFSDDDVYSQGSRWYRGLFADASIGDLRGESSTHYTKLPFHGETISRIHAELGEGSLKLIYVMRHPIDRLVSHYIHEWTQGVVSDNLDTALGKHTEMVDYGCYAMQLEPWINAFGKSSILPLFADRLRFHPQATLERVCQFLEYKQAPTWNESIGDQNVSAVRVRKSSARYFASISALRWASRTFLPESWRDRAKRPWIMTDRPELSAESLSNVERRFDEDLSQLGGWLGLELSCASWKRIAAEETPRWV